MLEWDVTKYLNGVQRPSWHCGSGPMCIASLEARPSSQYQEGYGHCSQDRDATSRWDFRHSCMWEDGNRHLQYYSDTPLRGHRPHIVVSHLSDYVLIMQWHMLIVIKSQHHITEELSGRSLDYRDSLDALTHLRNKAMLHCGVSLRLCRAYLYVYDYADHAMYPGY